MTSRRWSIALAALLLLAGASLLLVGVWRLGFPEKLAFHRATPTSTTAPTVPLTATEPILPPPPTATATATATPAPNPTTVGRATAVKPTGSVLATTGPAPTNFPPATPGSTASASPTNPAPPTPGSTASASPTTTPPLATPASTAAPTPRPKSLYSLRQRLGVGAAGLPAGAQNARQLGFGWYLSWAVRPDSFQSAEVEYVPMIRLGPDGASRPAGQELLAAVDALPGALWLIGNEPDVKWQDNVPADVYARAYHDLYAQLKARDPACQVAIGGVSQPTPLRLRYLDSILEAYRARYGQPMPVDVWNVHNFILREEQDSWGVDIPPGMPDRSGALREIADHDDMAIFRQQILDFRRWMKARGQQDKPLIVTEYGILLPNDYGFPPDKVERFMLDTFEFFRTAADPALGYPADGYRLVQRWCWFSLLSERYPTGNLASSDGKALTPLGLAFSNYAYSSP